VPGIGFVLPEVVSLRQNIVQRLDGTSGLLAGTTGNSDTAGSAPGGDSDERTLSTYLDINAEKEYWEE
jgi:hypothetical protein